MTRLSTLAILLSLVVGVAGCSKEESEGPAERMGRQIDEAAETMQGETAEAVEATQEEAAEAKAALGEAMEETGKEMQQGPSRNDLSGASRTGHSPAGP